MDTQLKPFTQIPSSFLYRPSRWYSKKNFPKSSLNTLFYFFASMCKKIYVIYKDFFLSCHPSTDGFIIMRVSHWIMGGKGNEGRKKTFFLRNIYKIKTLFTLSSLWKKCGKVHLTPEQNMEHIMDEFWRDITSLKSSYFLTHTEI